MNNNDPINAKNLTPGQLILVGDSVFKVLTAATEHSKGTALLHSGRSMQKTITLNDWANFYTVPSETPRDVPVEATKGASTTANYMQRQTPVETNPAVQEAVNNNALDIIATAASAASAEVQATEATEAAGSAQSAAASVEIVKAAIPSAPLAPRTGNKTIK